MAHHPQERQCPETDHDGRDMHLADMDDECDDWPEEALRLYRDTRQAFDLPDDEADGNAGEEPCQHGPGQEVGEKSEPK
jgi:hypothetical protein